MIIIIQEVTGRAQSETQVSKHLEPRTLMVMVMTMMKV